MRFDRLLILLEFIDYDEEEREAEAMARADKYFMIGHHGEMQDEVGEKDDFCWLWVDGSLKVGNKSTHNMSFGTHLSDRARFKGWYDRGKHLISLFDQAMEVKSVEDIPQRVYNHLVRRFKTKEFRIF